MRNGTTTKLSLSSVKQRRQKGDDTTVYRYLMEKQRDAGAREPDFSHRYTVVKQEGMDPSRTLKNSVKY